MNTYRLHIDSDLQGPWSCVIKAASVDDAIAYGEQVFQNAVVTVSKIADIPRKDPAPPTPVPGFTRRELATIIGALKVWYCWLDLHESEKPDPLHMSVPHLRAYIHGPDCDLDHLDLTEVRELQSRIWNTLAMEAAMDNPF